MMCISKWSPLWRRKAVLILLVCVSAALGGCSILPQKKPLEVFVLSSRAAAVDVPPTRAILSIQQPNSSGMLSSANIVVMPRSHQLNAYKGVRWDAPLPLVLQEYLLRNFRSVPLFKAVVDGDTRVKADYHLVTDLLAFHSSYIGTPAGGNPRIEVEVDAQLIDAGSRTIVAQRRFSLTQPCNSAQVEDVVAAFNRAAAHLSNKMLEWSARSIAQQEQ